MGERLDRFRAAFNSPTRSSPRELAAPPTPKSKSRSFSAYTGWKMPSFTKVGVPDRKRLEECWTMYELGGMVAEAVDCYPLYVLARGGLLESEDDASKKVAQDSIDSFNFTQAISELVTDAIVCQHGFQEIMETAGGLRVLKRIDPRTMHIVKDEYGDITGYEQYAASSSRKPDATFTPDEVVHFSYKWLMHRAYDDIKRDTRTAESIAKAIERHGFPKYHVRLGISGEEIPDGLLKKVSDKFENLKTDNEMTTPFDVLITPIDTTGLPNIMDYNNIMVQRLCSAIGTPEEMLGLGRGSTEATANVRLQSFYTKAAAIQGLMEDCINPQYFDKMTDFPGQVWYKFNDPNPTDDLQKASVVQALRSNPLEPTISVDEARKYMGWEGETE